MGVQMFSYLAPIRNMVNWFHSFQKEMRQTEVEAYISSRAKHPGDVDRLMREFEARSRLGF